MCGGLYEGYIGLKVGMKLERDFLCAVHNLTIMNAWFEKRQVHLGTWTHPAIKQSHLMRNGQRILCCDVKVWEVLTAGPIITW